MLPRTWSSRTSNGVTLAQRSKLAGYTMGGENQRKQTIHASHTSKIFLGEFYGVHIFIITGEDQPSQNQLYIHLESHVVQMKTKSIF